MALLHDVNYLSASQLALLGCGGDSTCARRRLRLLHDHELIDKSRPPAAAGSYEWNYRLAVEGWRVLEDCVMCAEGKSYSPADIHSIAYVEHDLQVNALVLHIARRASTGDGPLLDAMPFGWHGPHRGEIDPRDERPPEDGCEPSPSLPPVFYRAGSREGVLKPDATLILGGAEPCQAVLIEFDRTARPHKQLDRLRRYDWLLTEGWMDGRFAHHPIPPAMVLVTLRESTLAALVRAADETLCASRGKSDQDPLQGDYRGRDRIVFTTRERILARDWRMLRVPRLTPDLRGHDQRECVPAREVTMDLPALSAEAARLTDAS
ncbi:MAG TPA: replication-relaxation family protein [Solirubrobacteraceae bacterium]|nr:replication-relaxation family protein [Solirubrobacteraceae bacterium]